MGEFFRGWRRKLGCVTLVVALTFMAGWMRGRFICDIADFGGRGGYQRLNASCYGLIWFWNEGDPRLHYGDWIQIEQHRIGSANGPHPAEFHLGDVTQREILWYWHWAGFHFSQIVWNSDRMRITMWVVPYWSITIPLTAVSLWLLLIKPRRSFQKKITDLGDAEGA